MVMKVVRPAMSSVLTVVPFCLSLNSFSISLSLNHTELQMPRKKKQRPDRPPQTKAGTRKVPFISRPGLFTVVGQNRLSGRNVRPILLHLYRKYSQPYLSIFPTGIPVLFSGILPKLRGLAQLVFDFTARAGYNSICLCAVCAAARENSIIC